ncbi:MAG: response regulator [Melioribacteraceae bacterium]|jgi:CheY-like chemotaxis protein/anti-sigma regulatory factor (Ser/Thr protein kinase)|nr:response regulator [Melioribacteraceae bacterium]RJP63666.1 MAG: hybrid sensor histidine kinase/response regulator [Ignavibacteriales bacterium]WKZ69924.1 MAG: response regulator [Melioribacteraceae bacterium]
MEYKILVVEDDPFLRSNIADILETENYKVITAENGSEGIEKAVKYFPDLILSDIMMPKMNGFEFIEEIMKHDELSSTPIILLTAKAEQKNIRRGMSLGADDYLTKPFQIDDLLAAVAARLKKVENVKQKTKALKDEISSKVPHELRTPLVPILGFSELLLGEENLDQVKEMAQLIHKNGKILHQKVEKFLLYKDLIFIKDGNRDKMKANNPSTLSDESVRYSLLGLESNLKATERIKADIESVSFDIDEFFINTVIKELVENALKYSNIEKEVTIKGIKDTKNYLIRIKDNGHGMTAEQIKAIDAFGRFEAKNFYESGLGLGLAIVSKTIKILRGEFKIKSELNKYTICEILLPLN